MPIELKLLVWAAALTFIQCLIAVTGAFLQVGLPKLAGNRDDMPAITGWAGRAERAHRNMLQSLVLFTALVLVAQVTSKLNATTALGCALRLCGRSCTQLFRRNWRSATASINPFSYLGSQVRWQ